MRFFSPMPRAFLPAVAPANAPRNPTLSEARRESERAACRAFLINPPTQRKTR